MYLEQEQDKVMVSSTSKTYTAPKEILAVVLSGIAGNLLEDVYCLPLEQPPLPSYLPTVFIDSVVTSVGFSGTLTGSLTIHCTVDLADLLFSLQNMDSRSENHPAVCHVVEKLALDVMERCRQYFLTKGVELTYGSPVSIIATKYYLASRHDSTDASVCCNLLGHQLFISISTENSSVFKDVISCIRQEDDWQALAVERGDLGLWSFDASDGEADFNSKWAEILGYHPDELTPDIQTWQKLIHPEDIEQVVKALHDHLAGRSVMFESKHRLMKKDGNWIQCIVRGKVREGVLDNSRQYFCGILLDIDSSS